MRSKFSLLAFLAFTQLFLLNANADPKTRYDGLSCTSSRGKPSKDMLCGTNSAWAMSAQTITSIYTNLGRNLGLSETDIRSLCAEDKRVQQKLRDQFGSDLVVCKVTLKPNGRIEKIAVKRSSGSQDADQKIVDFIKNAGPFNRNDFPESLSYSVEVPSFNVKPDWW
jgi:TonB family protein